MRDTLKVTSIRHEHNKDILTVDHDRIATVTYSYKDTDDSAIVAFLKRIIMDYLMNKQEDRV